LVSLASCTNNHDTKEVDLEKIKPVKLEENFTEKSNKKQSMKVAIGSMITPREGYAYYKRLIEYIGQKMGRDIEIIDKDTYAEVNDLLKRGELDFSFVCGGPYVKGQKEFDLELLVAPEVNGKAEYYSYIIVPYDSQVNTIQDLRGKVFAFTDPISNTGKIVPTYMLSEINETPELFFKKYIFTYAHDKSILAVADKIVDGAAVDSLIWEYLNINNPDITSRTKIVVKSQPYGIPPVVVPKKTAAEDKKRLREIFLNLHNEEDSRKILKNMLIDKFVVVDDSIYDSIRHMETAIEQIPK
jgi:phosphonate transport system substrate-binding protein